MLRNCDVWRVGISFLELEVNGPVAKLWGLSSLILSWFMKLLHFLFFYWHFV